MFSFLASPFPNRNALDNIELLLSKRGSDELNTDVINNVFMMHSRLSITGTKHKSSQPIHSASGRYCIVFNGEIYSIFGEERSYIQEYGDTLALIKAIEKYGIEDCLLRLNGMFSIVIALVLGVGAAAIRRFFSNLRKKKLVK